MVNCQLDGGDGNLMRNRRFVVNGSHPDGRGDGQGLEVRLPAPSPPPFSQEHRQAPLLLPADDGFLCGWRQQGEAEDAAGGGHGVYPGCLTCQPLISSVRQDFVCPDLLQDEADGGVVVRLVRVKIVEG